jgi:molybdopterin converting factor small subunit
MELKLFGAFRKYADASSARASIELLIPEGCEVSELRVRLRAYLENAHPDFRDSELLDECAFATESRVLLPNEIVPSGQTIAILPPVCGG